MNLVAGLKWTLSTQNYVRSTLNSTQKKVRSTLKTQNYVGVVVKCVEFM